MMTDPTDHLAAYNMKCRVARSGRVASLIEGYCLGLDGRSKQRLLDQVFEWHSAGLSSVEGMYDAFRIHRDLPGHAPGVDTHERCLDLYAAEVCRRENYARRDLPAQASGVDNYERYVDRMPDGTSDRQLRPSLTEEVSDPILELYPKIREIAETLRARDAHNNIIEVDEIVNSIVVKMLEPGFVLEMILHPCATKEQEAERDLRLLKRMLGVVKQLRSGASTRPVSASGRAKSRGDKSSKEASGSSARAGDNGFAVGYRDDSEREPNTTEPPGGSRTARCRVDPERDPNAGEPWQLLGSDDDEDAARAFFKQLTWCEPKKRIAYCLNRLCMVKLQNIAPMLGTSEANVCRWIKDVECGLERPTL
jgi:hypothetical protein